MKKLTDSANIDDGSTLDFRGFVLDVDYRRVTEENDLHAEIVLYLRDLDGNRSEIRSSSYKPYIFADLSESEYQQMLAENQEFSSWILKYVKISKTRYSGGKSIDVVQLFGKRPWEVPLVREILDRYSVKHFETDIPFVQRYMIDRELFGLRGVRISQSEEGVIDLHYTNNQFEPKILSLDIEIDSQGRSDNDVESLASIITTGSRRITAISCWTGKDANHGIGKSFILEEDTDRAEITFLISSFHFIWKEFDPDVVVTYNGDSFDFPYLKRRMQRLGIPLNILSPPRLNAPEKSRYSRGWLVPGLLIFDLFRRTKWKYTADGSKSLHSIAKELLGEGKNNPSLNHGTVWRKSLEDSRSKQTFEEYILRDAELTYKLWFSLEMPEWLEVIKITGIPPSKGMYFTERQAGEFLVFRNMYRSNVLIPALPGNKEKQIRKKTRERTKGGLVLEPTREIAKAVLICDFTSMYPSLVVTHNIGAESFLGMKPDLKDRFVENPKTTMSLTIESLLTQRKNVKQEITEISKNVVNAEITIELINLKRYSWAIKILMNSLIGGYNFIGSRLYSSDLSNTVTGLGRQYMQELALEVKSFDPNYEVIYGDTDSIFVETTLEKETNLLWELPISQSLNYEKYVPQYTKLLEHLQSTLSSKMRLELQDIALRILFNKGAKKRYTYISAITKKVSIIGFEAIRHDWSPFAKEAQKEAIEIILNTGDLEHAKEKMLVFLQNLLKKEDHEFRESVTILGAIKRDPKKYKNITPGIAAFQHYTRSRNEDEGKEWKKYEYFPYIIKQGSGPIRNRAFHPTFVMTKEIDMRHYLTESLRAINRFNLNLTIEDVLGVQQTELGEYFDVSR